MLGYARISKKAFYLKGGLSNPDLVRTSKRGTWQYWELTYVGFYL
jgi:hypothetical protein